MYLSSVRDLSLEVPPPSASPNTEAREPLRKHLGPQGPGKLARRQIQYKTKTSEISLGGLGR